VWLLYHHPSWDMLGQGSTARFLISLGISIRARLKACFSLLPWDGSGAISFEECLEWLHVDYQPNEMHSIEAHYYHTVRRYDVDACTR
jgi:hypothetical protein